MVNSLNRYPFGLDYTNQPTLGDLMANNAIENTKRAFRYANEKPVDDAQVLNLRAYASQIWQANPRMHLYDVESRMHEHMSRIKATHAEFRRACIDLALVRESSVPDETEPSTLRTGTQCDECTDACEYTDRCPKHA